MICFIWFLVGLFVGAILGFMFAALVAANAADDPEPDGIDEVLNEIEKGMRNDRQS